MAKENSSPDEKWQKGKKLKAATIGFYHQGCQTSTSTEKFPHISLEQVSPVVYFKRSEDRMDYSLLWNVRAEKKSELEEYLKYVKKRDDTKQLNILDIGNNQALILLRFYSPSSSYEKVLESNLLPTSPTLASEGFETYRLLSFDPSGIKKLSKELSSIGDVRILRVGDYKPGASNPSLTEKQKDALQTALINGYYSWPRHVGLVDLAKAAKVSRRSMQERLRRAEANLFPELVEKYLKKAKK